MFSFQTGADHETITGLGAPAPGNLIGVPQFIATSTLSNDVVGSNLFLYDSSFTQTMTGQVDVGWSVVPALISYWPSAAMETHWLGARPALCACMAAEVSAAKLPPELVSPRLLS